MIKGKTWSLKFKNFQIREGVIHFGTDYNGKCHLTWKREYIMILIISLFELDWRWLDLTYKCILSQANIKINKQTSTLIRYKVARGCLVKLQLSLSWALMLFPWEWESSSWAPVFFTRFEQFCSGFHKRIAC